MESKKTLNPRKASFDKINTKNKLENLKSKFILKRIFNNVKRFRTLEIIKINKNMQQKLNLTLHDYKEYSEKFSIIEIEIIPTGNKTCKFINIDNIKDKKYFHIYFNKNKKKEIESTYLTENISVINIIIDYQIKSFRELFYYCECIESINFKKFYRNNISDMSMMFGGCSSLKQINFSQFNTDIVDDMSGMFFKCTSLKEINLSNFNTSNVTDMSCMFYECSSLKELNLSNFNTNNVINFSGMFYRCKSLKELNLSHFNTNNAIDITFMFYECSSLKEINLNKFNFKKIIKMYSMFEGCQTLEEINISDFNVNDFTEMESMFKGCLDNLKNKIRDKFKNIKENAF